MPVTCTGKESNVLNDRLSELMELWEDKPIQYVGWFWRYCDFSHVGEKRFQVIPRQDVPSGHPPRDRDLVCFPCDKFSYPLVTATAEQWEDIVDRVAAFAEFHDEVTAARVNEALQALIVGNDYSWWTPDWENPDELEDEDL